ncbi:MAG: hypothetical protein OEZ13_10010 [Spirochaetia bacterium]|nr:hypothetical protein [Spirochaetia bacterium]
MKKFTSILAIVFLAFSMPLFSQDAAEETISEEAKETESSEEKDGHAIHSNHAAIFLGATTFYDKSTSFTAGADYEYRFSAMHGLLGLGLILDFAFRDHMQTIVAGALFIHPAGGFKIALAPGVEMHSGEKAFVFRGGLAYDIHVGSLSLTPTVNFDYAHHHVAYVYGLGIGYGF